MGLRRLSRASKTKSVFPPHPRGGGNIMPRLAGDWSHEGWETQTETQKTQKSKTIQNKTNENENGGATAMFKVFKVVPPGSGQLAGGENLKKN